MADVEVYPYPSITTQVFCPVPVVFGNSVLAPVATAEGGSPAPVVFGGSDPAPLGTPPSYIELRIYTGVSTYNLCPNYKDLTFDVKFNDVSAFSAEYPYSEAVTLGLSAQKMVGVAIGFSNGTVKEVARYLIEDIDDNKIADGVRYRKIGGRSALAYLEDAVVYPQNWPVTVPAGHEFGNVSAGNIFRTLIDKAKARGCFPNLDNTSYTGVTASNGAPWAIRHTQTFQNGATVLSILLDMMQKQFVDAKMDGWTLKLYNGGTSGKHVSIGTVEVRPAHNATEMTQQIASKESCSAVLVGGDSGTAVERTSSAAQTLIGRRKERGAQQGGVDDAGVMAIIGDAELGIYGKFIQEETVGITDLTLVPFSDFEVGDWIWVRFDTDSAPLERRVYQIAVSIDQNGNRKVGLTLNDIIYENDVRLQRKIEAYSGSGSNYGSIPVPSVDLAEDQTTPKTPTGLILDDEAYGPTEAAIVASWSPVTQNLDGSICDDLLGYDLRWKYDTEVLWSHQMSSTETSCSFSPVMTDTTIQVQVRAKDKSGHFSDWCELVAIEVLPDAPTTSPTPVVTGSVKAVFVRYEPVPNPSAYGVQVHMSTSSGFTPVLNDSATLVSDLWDTTGVLIRNDPAAQPLVVGTTYYFKTIAYNSGGSAPPSTQASGQLAQVNHEDIVANAITADNLLANSVTAAKIDSLAVTTDKLDAGAVTAAKLNATAINGMTITGAIIQTSATPSVGIKITASGMYAYNSIQQSTFSLDAQTGSLSMVGEFASAVEGQRLRINPDGSGQSEIRFYPTDNTGRYAYVQGYNKAGYIQAAGIRVATGRVGTDDPTGLQGVLEMDWSHTFLGIANQGSPADIRNCLTFRDDGSAVSAEMWVDHGHMYVHCEYGQIHFDPNGYGADYVLTNGHMRADAYYGTYGGQGFLRSGGENGNTDVGFWWGADGYLYAYDTWRGALYRIQN